MKQNKSILITADIDESLYEDLSKDNIVEKHGFINIDFNKNLNWHFSIEKAIFTSKNAVLSLLENGNYGNIKKVYCVGEKTKALLEENGFNVVLNENYSEKLAIELIKSVGTDKIVYFCGNKRKKHIENTLDPKKIDIVEAYKNSVNPKFYKKSFITKGLILKKNLTMLIKFAIEIKQN